MKEKLLKLNKELNIFYKQIEPSIEDLIIRKNVYLQIKKILYLNYKLKMFGSSADKLITKESDLDLAIITEQNSNLVLPKVKEILEMSEGLNIKENEILYLSNAKVPILKFIIAKYNLSVDISTNCKIILKTSKIIKSYQKKFPILKNFFLVINFILKQRKLYKNGGINNTALKVLIIHFLNLHPLIQINMINLESNFGVLMLDFFQYFGFCISSEFMITFKGFKEKINWLYLSIEDPATKEELCYGCDKSKEIETLFKYLYRVMIYALNSEESVLLNYWIK